MANRITKPKRVVDYPTSDGRPMAETDRHRDIMVENIDVLKYFFRAEPLVYVSGNLLLYYEEGNKRKHVSPDTFVVFGVEKRPDRPRDYYLLWEEGVSPSAIVEVTSKTTRKEDTDKKRILYRDVLKVKEYYLFDPTGDYLDPILQGFRLENGDYVRVAAVEGRVPSEELGLHLEADGLSLRFWDPSTRRWVPNAAERLETERQGREAEKQRADEEKRRADEERQRADAEKERADRLAAELAELRRERTPS